MDAKASARIIKVALAHGFLTEAQLKDVLPQAGGMKSYDLIDYMVEKGFLQEAQAPKLVELLGASENEQKSATSGEIVLEKKLKEFETGLQSIGKSRAGKRSLTAAVIRDRSISTVGMTIGNYQVLEEIARGSMGAVFSAKPLGILDVMAKGWGLAEEVALKVMLTSGRTSQADVQRFRDECKALINLQHDNIIKVFDLGEEEGLWYYAMELIRDEDVRILFDKGKPPPVTMALSLTRDLAEAMSKVHKAGLLHRDIKPSNVLLDRSSHPYRPVLIDFGLIADMTDESDNVILGTPNYMPPEQANPSGGVRVGQYSDVYALGATLYFLLTGKPPFEGWTARGIIKQVLSDTPKAPETLRPGIPPEVSAICMKCLEKLPKDRYRTCKALVKDIDRFLRKHRWRLKIKNFYMKLRKTLFGKKK